MTLAERLRHFFAMREYRRRRRARDDRRYPTTWLSHLQLIWSDVRLLHDIEPDHVDEKFLGNLVKGRDDALKALASRATFSWVITAYLALDYFNIDIPLSIAGFTISSSSLVTELLMILSAALFFMGLSRLVSAMVLGEAIKATVQALYPPESWHIHKLYLFPAETPILFPHPLAPHLVWKRPTRVVAWFSLFVLVLLLVILVVGFLGSRYLIYAHVWAMPEAETSFGHLAVLVSAATDVIGILYILTFVVPFPYRDYSLLQTFEIAEQTSPATVSRLNSEHYDEDVKDRMEMESEGHLKPGEPDPPN